jgi:glyoxylase-like metal-dependent hydrolase (beta-lactamase superfamily II)
LIKYSFDLLKSKQFVLYDHFLKKSENLSSYKLKKVKKAMNKVSTLERFCMSGPILEDFHIIDLFLYDSSLFANVILLEDSEYTVIVDTGTSKTIGSIINYLNFCNINLNNVLIIPTHHHFDHVGGINSLIEFLESKNSNIQILASPMLANLMKNPREYEKEAKKGFQDTVGHLSPIKPSYFREVSEADIIKLGDEWTVKILNTPGHCPDHVSPLFTRRDGEKVCFLGEAFGINLKNDLYPIPASSAPHFNSVDYIASIKKIIDYCPDLAIFSHYGGIKGAKTIETTGLNAIRTYRDFRKNILDIYRQKPKTKYITEKLFQKYAEGIATEALNMDLAKNLAFTIIYGILMDEGLKGNKLKSQRRSEIKRKSKIERRSEIEQKITSLFSFPFY